MSATVLQCSRIVLEGLAHLLSWLFVIGMAGCLVVIPYTAYQLLSVLFEKDAPEESNPTTPLPIPPLRVARRNLVLGHAADLLGVIFAVEEVRVGPLAAVLE